jgi:tetratricopeptide (TPR) repeat protein
MVAPRPRFPVLPFRDAEREAVAQLLRGSNLVTLVGAPGVGKSRLAQSVATDVADRLSASPDGSASASAPASHPPPLAAAPVTVVSLADAKNAASLVRAVAHALRVGGAASRSADAFARALRTRIGTRLVVLDQADGLDDDARAQIASWSQWVALLVTAREPLRVLGERVFPVPPLRVRPEPGESLAPAAELLVALLRGGRSPNASAALPPEMQHELARLAVELDGLPLAIELVAPQVATSGVALVRRRFRASPDAVLIGGGGQDSVLRRAIASSVDALHADARRMFARLSVFRGDFGLVDAIALLAPIGEHSALELLHTLCERSLLVPLPEGHAARFRMLAPIRVFAAEVLAETGEREEMGRRHAVHFARRTAVSPSDWTDLVAAVEWSLAAASRANDTGDGDAVEGATRTCLAAFSALEPILSASGSSHEHLELAERVASSGLSADVPNALRARALLARGDAKRRAGDLEGAFADFSDAYELADAANDAEVRARAERGRAAIHHARGELEAAVATLTRALDALPVDASRETRGILHSDLGTNALAQAQPDRAREHFEKAVDALERTGNVLHRAGASANLAVACIERGDFAGAGRRLAEALELTRAGDSIVRGFVLANLGLLLHFEGSLERASEHYEQALVIAREAEHPLFVGTFSGYVGIARLECDEVATARALFASAVDTLEGAHDARYAALFLAFKAACEALEGRTQVAEADIVRAQALAPARPDAATEAIALVCHELRNAGLVPAVPHAEPAARGPMASSIEARLAARCACAIERIARKAGRGRARLLVAPEARWFQLGVAPRVSLEAHASLRRILLHLAHAHGAGETPPRDALVRAAWPNERILPAAANNRLKVALSLLRRLGLADVIETIDRSYRIRPSCAVTFATSDDAHG